MRVGASWSDARILNLSTRGMMIQSGTVPQRGNYLEIRRGQHVVVARVVWSEAQRFGVQTQDPVCADALIQDAVSNSTTAHCGSSVAERRSLPRPARECHEASRNRGRVMEFATLAVLGVASAFLFFATIDELLGRPLSALEAALVTGGAG